MSKFDLRCSRRLFCQSLALGLAAVASLGASAAVAEERKVIELRIGAGHPAKAMPAVGAVESFFVPETAKRVRERTGYELKWVEAYGGSVAKLPEVLEATKSGLLDFGMIAVAFNPSQLMIHNMAYYAPFGSPSALITNRATRRTFDEVPELASIYEERYGQKFLAVASVGNYQLGTTFPWEKLDDLKGKKIAGAGPNLPMLEGTGAVPVQSNLNEAYNALQTGVYNGWIMFPGSYLGFKLHEVAPHFKLVDFGTVSVFNLTVNLRTWRKLPPEVQKIIVEVARDYERVAGELSDKADAEALETLKKTAKVTTLSADEKRRWAQALAGMAQQRAKEADKAGFPGTKVMRAYIKNLEAEGHKFPVAYRIQ